MKAFFLPGYPDFLQNYYSPPVLLSGQNPYTFSNMPFFPNVYPPVTILFFFLFSFFPLMLAGKIWFIVSFLCLILSVYFIFLIAKKNIFSRLGLMVLGFCFFSFPVKFTFGMGQINHLILFLTVFSVYLLHRKKILSSSFFLSLSLSMKFFPMFLPLYFLITRRWRILALITSFFAVFHLIIFLIFPNLVIYFYTKVIFEFVNGWKIDYYNQSLTGFIGRNISDLAIRDIARSILTLVFAVTSFFVIIKTRFNEKLIYLHISLLISLNLLINNFSWQHHFVFMIFPFLINLFYLIDNKKYKELVVLFVAYVLISFNFKMPQTFLSILTSNVFYGAVLMWFLQIIILMSFQKPQLNFPKDKPR